MATAEKKTITREVVKTEEVEVFRLDLSREEAEAMAAVFMYVGGSPDHSPRGHLEKISNALARVGVTYNSVAYKLSERTLAGAGIRFDNYPRES